MGSLNRVDWNRGLVEWVHLLGSVFGAATVCLLSISGRLLDGWKWFFACFL